MVVANLPYVRTRSSVIGGKQSEVVAVLAKLTRQRRITFTEVLLDGAWIFFTSMQE